MAERDFTNETPFAVQELYLADEDGRPLLAVVVQATYEISTGGGVVLLEEQPPVDVAGIYHGDPATSSLRYEPAVAPLKLATDVVLVGHAYPSRPGTPHVDVGFQVGPVRNIARVYGDRRWERRRGFPSITPPEPFDRMPLTFERAFGGWDRTPADPAQHTVQPRNPVGVGYHHSKYGLFVEGAPLPNIESPAHPIREYTDAPPPAGFGFILPGWEPRRGYAGAYDEVWAQQRRPLLPRDFDRRFYNAAPPGQIAPGYLRGDEPVLILHAVPEGRAQFALPGEPPPQVTITTETSAPHAPPVHLDTVVVNTDARWLTLQWRTRLTLPRGAHDVRAVRIEPAPASVHALRPQHSAA